MGQFYPVVAEERRLLAVERAVAVEEGNRAQVQMEVEKGQQSARVLAPAAVVDGGHGLPKAAAEERLHLPVEVVASYVGHRRRMWVVQEVHRSARVQKDEAAMEGLRGGQGLVAEERRRLPVGAEEADQAGVRRHGRGRNVVVDRHDPVQTSAVEHLDGG